MIFFSEEQPQVLKRREAWQMALLVLATLALFSLDFLYGDFSWNWIDGMTLGELPHFQMNLKDMWYHLSVPQDYVYSPVAVFSLMADRVCFGEASFGYHLHSIFGHATGVLALALLLKQMRIQSLAACAIALVLGAMPWCWHAVAWAGGRRHIACALFGFLALWLFLKMRKSDVPRLRRRWCVLSIVCGMISMGAHPAAAVLPVIMLLFSFMYGRGITRARPSHLDVVAVSILVLFALFVRMMYG